MYELQIFSLLIDLLPCTEHGSVAGIIETNGPWLLTIAVYFFFYCLYQIIENSKLNNMVFVYFALLFMDLK